MPAMSDTFKTLRRLDTVSADVREIRLVKNASGLYAEVSQFANGVTALRPVPPRYVSYALSRMDEVAEDLAKAAKRGPRKPAA
jgi:hypothetical protein